jgi:predicted  nucleic acid-binding Zn-ribbon protein
MISSGKRKMSQSYIPTEIVQALNDINERIERIQSDLDDQAKLDTLIEQDIERILSERKLSLRSDALNIVDFKSTHLESLRRDKKASLERAKRRLVELKNEMEVAFNP